MGDESINDSNDQHKKCLGAPETLLQLFQQEKIDIHGRRLGYVGEMVCFKLKKNNKAPFFASRTSIEKPLEQISRGILLYFGQV